MSEQYLQVAKTFIQDKDFASARKVLAKIPDHPTAQKWLARIEQIELRNVVNIPAQNPVKLPSRLEVIISKHLSPDEIVLWYEQPEPTIYSRYFTPGWMNGLFVLMGFGLLTFNVYAQFVLLSGGVTASFLIRIVLPISFLVAPFIRRFLSQQRAATIHYVITDRQGLMIEKLKVTVLSLAYSGEVEVVKEQSGFRSVILRCNSDWWSFFVYKLPVGFLGITQADFVQKLIAEHWN